jgi:hypothetical protein
MGTVDWLRSLTLIVKYTGIEGKDKLNLLRKIHLINFPSCY